MRWTLGNYTLKYNPNTLSKTWNPLTDVNINANGQMSNPNLMFNGKQSFAIDVYDKPTSCISSPITGSYISVSEKRVNEHMYLLKTGGVFDVKGKDNTLYGTYTLTSGNGVTLPNASPSSIVDWDSGLAFVCPDIKQCSLVITDENGLANRKYVYSTDDLMYGKYVTWDYNSHFLILNPYGGIYSVNTSSGSESLLYQFSDYSNNFSNKINRYTGIIVYQKENNYYIGVLRDTKDIMLIDYNTLNIVCKAETDMSNVLAVSYSNYSNNSFILFSSKVMQMTMNTCRIDVELVKSAIAGGQIVVNDEQGFPYVLAVDSLNITREANKDEARYQLDFQAEIIYTNKSFGNKWTTNSRSF